MNEKQQKDLFLKKKSVFQSINQLYSKPKKGKPLTHDTIIQITLKSPLHSDKTILISAKTHQNQKLYEQHHPLPLTKVHQNNEGKKVWFFWTVDIISRSKGHEREKKE